MTMKRIAVICVVATCALQACMTAQTYDGPARAKDEVAHISGDLRFNGNAPISVVLRRVDELVLNVGQNAVDVLPGKHTLLVDCRIQETGNVARFTIEYEFVAGQRYHLNAETAPGVRECAAVSVEASD
jgi:hypothetical protein